MLRATEKKFTLEDVNRLANELLNNDKRALREELIDLTAVGEEGELRSDDEINDIWKESAAEETNSRPRRNFRRLSFITGCWVRRA